MSDKPITRSSTINSHVLHALHICEDYTSDHSDLRFEKLADAKHILNTLIPKEPGFAAFVNKHSEFYTTFLQLQDFVKRHEGDVLEHRFQKLRRSSQPSKAQIVSYSGKQTIAATPPNSFLPYPLSPDNDRLKMPQPNATQPLSSHEGSTSKQLPRPDNDALSPQEPIVPANNLSQQSQVPQTGGNKQQPQMPQSVSLSPHTQRGCYEISASILSNKIAVSRVLVLDIRSHSSFDNGHIDCPLIACFEPDSLRLGMSIQDLEDTLVISPEREAQCFADARKSDMIVLYDDHSTSASDNWALTVVVNALLQAGMHSYILKGGWEAWVATFPNNVIPQTRISIPEPPRHEIFTTKTQLSPQRKSQSPAVPPKEVLKHTETPIAMPSLPPVPSKQSLPIAIPKPVPKPVSKPVPRPVSKSPPVRTFKPSANNGYADEPPKPVIPSLRVSKLLSNTSQQSQQLQLQQQQPQLGLRTTISGNISKKFDPIPYVEERVPPFLLCTTGLKNLGNTCYMNCILQCLISVPQLIEPFSNGSYRQYINFNSRLGYKGQFANAFAMLVLQMLQPDRFHQPMKYVEPIGIKQLSAQIRPDSFSGYEQQDCQEFLTFVLDGLHEDLNSNGDKQKLGELGSKEEERREQLGIRIASAIEWERYLRGDTSLIVDLFQGQYLSQLQCLTCKRTSTTYNAFSSLSLPLAAPKLLGQHTSLKTCFDEFVKPEILDGDNAWNCPHCQQKRKTVKTLQISRLPPILVIHLKRFKRSAMGGTNKLETPVDYPLRNLDLTKYWPQLNQGSYSEKELELLSQIPVRGQRPPFIYDLRAVTLHHGSLRGGHYTAVVQKPGKGWFYFDDSNVSVVKEQSAVSKHAYVLVYKRRM